MDQLPFHQTFVRGKVLRRERDCRSVGPGRRRDRGHPRGRRRHRRRVRGGRRPRRGLRAPPTAPAGTPRGRLPGGGPARPGRRRRGPGRGGGGVRAHRRAGQQRGRDAVPAARRGGGRTARAGGRAQPARAAQRLARRTPGDVPSARGRRGRDDRQRQRRPALTGDGRLRRRQGRSGEPGPLHGRRMGTADPRQHSGPRHGPHGVGAPALRRRGRRRRGRAHGAAGRLAEPAEVGDACVFLASDRARYISGASLHLHGGGEAPAFLAAARDGRGAGWAG